jgi:hypothetical protein
MNKDASIFDFSFYEFKELIEILDEILVFMIEN